MDETERRTTLASRTAGFRAMRQQADQRAGWCCWLPQRWRKLELAGDRQQRFLAALMRLIRRLERISRPRLRFVFDHRLSNIVFGLLVIAGCLGAFLAPPFTGLDTLPALGVVLLSLAVLLEDIALVAAALVVGVAGVVLEIVLGSAAINGLGHIL